MMSKKCETCKIKILLRYYKRVAAIYEKALQSIVAYTHREKKEYERINHHKPDLPDDI